MESAGKLADHVKVDVALSPQSLASTNATGEYFSLETYRKALFQIQADAMADGDTVIAQVMQAKDAAGTGATAITNAAATITAPVKATALKVTGTTVVDGNKITINGQVFTCEDTNPDASLGQFASGASDTEAMANLTAVVNALLPDILATSSSAVMTLVARETGEATITTADEESTLVPAVLRAQSQIQIEPSFLDLANGFTHVAIKVTTDATIVCGATLLRGNGRFSPVQAVAASKDDVS